MINLSKHFSGDGSLDWAGYQEGYGLSVRDPEAFWAEQAKRLSWSRKWDWVLKHDYKNAEHSWFGGGRLNACYNCVDRHVEAGFGDKVAIIWEGDDPSVSKAYTYWELQQNVARFANVLKRLGVKSGDRVTLYMPMIIELPLAVLACARIGAIHSVVFGGFSPQSLRSRIEDCQSSFVVTADEGIRGAKVVPLKQNVDEALAEIDLVKHCLVVRRTGAKVNFKAGRDLWLHDLWEKESTECPPVEMDAEAPLFILYTSGSTGKPKGVLHTTGGYLLYASLTHQQVFNCQRGDIYWCTADIGWITGHSYILYGPLANGVTTIVFEGVPTYPDAGRCWDICDKHQVNVFYTAPTTIRALIREGDSYVERASLAQLKVLGSVGEPINPEVWNWYHRVVGKGKVPVVDTWWQTETGGIMIAPLPGITNLKPGSATLPLFGIRPVLLDDDGNRIEGEGQGNLCFEFPWPGQMRGVYGSKEKFYETYFAKFPGYYFSGDGAKRDKDGYYWILGRVDDVMNVSGHRIGTAEVESALVSHPKVAEAAVVSIEDAYKGEAIYAFVTLKASAKESDSLSQELKQHVKVCIGAIARPTVIHWAASLPKTRSGKLMRRILRHIARGSTDKIGDISTLADPSVVEALAQSRQAPEENKENKGNMANGGK